MMNIRSITVKWNLSLLFGEPVVDGVFKWEAGKNTPADYLDYRDCVLLECTPVKSAGYLVYIRITPTVPKAGEGFGFNTPGSPSWENIFCTRSGDNMTSRVPDFNEKMSKEIWRDGFYVTGVVLNRIGGKDGFLEPSKSTDQKAAKENASVNEAEKRAVYNKMMEDKAKSADKYSQLSHPYELALKDKDTSTTGKIHLLNGFNPNLKAGGFLIIVMNDDLGVVNQYNDPYQDIPVYKGWNKIRYSITINGYTKRGKADVFYKGESGKTLLYDDFSGGLSDELWPKRGYMSNYAGAIVSNGALLIRQGGEHTNVEVWSKELAADADKPLIIEFKSNMHSTDGCRKAWVTMCHHDIEYNKNCNCWEAVKIMLDMKNGEITCFINGEVASTKKDEAFIRADGKVQFGLTCYMFEKLEVDDVRVRQE